MNLNKISALIKWELLLQSKVNNLGKYFIAFCLFCCLTMVFSIDQADIQKFGVVFFTTCLPIAMLGFVNIIIKNDLEDGVLELCLTVFSPLQIVLAKFISIFLIVALACLISLPIVYIIFDLSLNALLLLLVVSLMLLMLASALVILMSAVQCYFRSNVNFLPVLIMPLLIPATIITGMVLQNHNVNLLLIMAAINLIFLPVCLLLICYLIKNIYNI